MEYKINSLITKLMVIAHYAKDIHYNCSGENFYSNHLLADRILENLNDYIDQLKEICLLGHNLKPLHSSVYLKNAAELVPQGASYATMRNLLLDSLAEIEEINSISKGDENVIGAIAQDIQNNLGLLNIMFGDNQNV